MVLYNGSYTAVREPRLLKNQRELDFGKGFYTTSDLEQATKWAQRTARRLLPQKLKDQFVFKSVEAIALLRCAEVIRL